MPDINAELKTVFEELRTAHEGFKTQLDSFKKSNEESGTVSGEFRAAFDKVSKDVERLDKKYNDLVKRSQRPTYNADGNEIDPEAETRRSRFVKELRYGVADSQTHMTNEERSLVGTSDADGNSLAPVGFESEITMAAYNEAAIRPLCMPRPTGNSVVYMPALSKPAVGWGRNGVDVSAQDLSTGGDRVEIFDLTALILIHNNTLEDSEADLWGELSDGFSMAVPEAEDVAFASGVGNESPQGILSDADVLSNVTNTGVAAAISDASNDGIASVITMQHELKQTYARNAYFVMNRKTQGAYRVLVDGNGQYLWQPPIQKGDPATLSGDPVAISEGMPDIAANAYPVAYGDFKRGYVIRDRRGIVIQRLNERYAEKRSTGFLLTKRVGGKVKIAEAFRVLKVSA